jgi:hypothetical protein
MTNIKVNSKSKKIMEKTRDQQLARIFSILDGDTTGYIRRKRGKMLVNLGDPFLNNIIAGVVLKHFKSSVQKLNFEVFKGLCEEEFRIPLGDGMTGWNRISKFQQGELTFGEAHESCGVEISFDASVSEDERERAVMRSDESRAQQESLKVKEREKKNGTEAQTLGFVQRLYEKNSAKEEKLEKKRRLKVQAELEECSFHPQTTKITDSASRRGSTIYERLLEKEKEKEAFLAEERRKKAVEAMKGCTFRPNLPSARYHSISPIKANRSTFSSSSLDIANSFIQDPMFLSSPLSVSKGALEASVLYSYLDLNSAPI